MHKGDAAQGSPRYWWHSASHSSLSSCGDLNGGELNRGVESLSAPAALDEILLGRGGGLLKRLRGPEAAARAVRWESVIEVGEQIAVHA